MKKILLLAVVCCTLMMAQAQRVYFIYLQSDDRSAFYLKTGDKVFSSTAHGYLIVPKLVDSTYNVVIGKPGQAEARFTIPVNGKDHGFLLRSSNQQLSLFNLQTMAVIEAATNSGGGVSYIQKTDRFATLLSKAADDSTLLRMAVFTKTEKEPDAAVANVEEEVKEETTQAAIAEKDTTAAVTQVNTEPVVVDTVATTAIAKEEPVKQQADVKAEEIKTETTKAEVVKSATVEETLKAEPEPTEPAADESVFKRSLVTRRAESSTSEGFGLVFTDNIDGVVDTIRLVIPNPRTVFRTGNEVEDEVKEKVDARFLELENKKTAAEPEIKEKKEEPKKRKGLFGRLGDNEEKESETVEKPAPKGKENVLAATCKSNASSNDFARLRRNMVGKSSEIEMIAEAEKAFKNDCFTTQQIKTLSSLLLTSQGRYNFFAAAYDHVSDKENFKTLQNELWDREDINRFKALLSR